jgi:undecaprenyl-diphosphatase
VRGARVNDFLLSPLLGVIEGLTEFLPVSSTAHLRIFEALAGVSLADGFWKMFTIVIQLGAICCLPIYFRRRIATFVGSFAGAAREGRWAAHPLSLTLVAFLCTVVPSLLLIKLIGKNLESLLVMGVALLAGGVVMGIVDALFARGRLGTRTERMEDMGVGQAVWVGLCQNFSAVFPGVSRSMATIAAGQLGGMTREAALEFSFFLSMPTMVAATGYDFVKTVLHGRDGALGAVHMTPHAWALLVIGFAVSFVVAYAVVAWFMAWVRHRGFVPFAVYRIVAGAAVLAWVAGGAR